MARWFRFYAASINDIEYHRLSDGAFRFLMGLRCCEVIYDGCLPSDDELEWQLRLGSESFAVGLGELIDAGFAERGPDGRLALIARAYENYRLSAAEWAELRAAVFRRDNYTCSYCGERGGKLECDHIRPLARGGSNDLD